MQYCYFQSPIGKLLLAGEDQVLEILGFSMGALQYTVQEHWRFTTEPFQQWLIQLEEYFASIRKNFDLPYKFQGTVFQQQVLQAVARVPYGQTASYADIAQQINHPLAVRAVGSANGRNKLPIIIPCHRIINKNGNLGGFGGTLAAKKFLLDLENPARAA